jgi:hypothetical protein
MSPSVACTITINSATISPSSWATDPQSQGQEYFIGSEASLNETVRYVVALGFGTFFPFVTIRVYFVTMFTKNATITSEHF